MANESQYKAARQGYYNITKNNIRDGGYYNQGDNGLRDGIYNAIYGGHLRLVKCFDRLGADIEDNEDLAISVIKKNNHKVFEYLVTRGLTMEYLTSDYVLEYPAKYNKYIMFMSVFRSMPHKHIDVNILLDAIIANAYRIIKFIVNHAPNLILADNVMNCAMREKDAQIVKIFLKAINWNTPQLVQFLNEHLLDNFYTSIDIIDLFIKAGADINYRGMLLKKIITQDQYNLFAYNSFTDNNLKPITQDTLDRLKYLIANRVIVNPDVPCTHPNDKYNLPLTLAVVTNSSEMVKIIIDAGADVNKCDGSALIKAIENVSRHYRLHENKYQEALKIMYMLLNAGANIHVGNNEPLRIAKLFDQNLYYQLLQHQTIQLPGVVENQVYIAIRKSDSIKLQGLLLTNPILDHKIVKSIRIPTRDIHHIVNTYLKTQDKELYDTISKNNMDMLRTLLASNIELDMKVLSKIDIRNPEMLSLLNDHMRKPYETQ
jgi:hypothetical protein